MSIQRFRPTNFENEAGKSRTRLKNGAQFSFTYFGKTTLLTGTVVIILAFLFDRSGETLKPAAIAAGVLYIYVSILGYQALARLILLGKQTKSALLWLALIKLIIIALILGLVTWESSTIISLLVGIGSFIPAALLTGLLQE